MQEKLLERKLRERTELLGGKALKFTSPYYTGMPDRLILLPRGTALWAEIKTTGKKPSKIQESRIKQLRDLGFSVFIIDSQETLEGLIDFCKERCSANGV